MLIIDAREQDSIDRALKVYKKKYEKSGVLKQLRERQAFTLPSVQKRAEKLKAIHREKVKLQED
ncbi:MAG: 30S ribosomal protein S21 [Chitinophagales bacterium]|nr:30S ribosomal protein S21 [Chitinophagales bacterium]